MTSRRLDLDVVTTGDTSGLTKTAAGFDRVTRSIDDVGDQARQSARAVDDLGDEAAQASRKLSGLFAEFGALGSKSGIKGLGKDLSGELSSAWSSISKGVSGRGGIIGALGVEGISTAAAAAAPLIGAAVTEGIMLGVGGAGIAVGIAGAFRAPEVKAAWSSFAETGGVVLAEAGQKFRAPLIDALDDADERLRGLDLAGAIAPLADTVGPLEAGLMGLAERAMPGIRTAAEAAVKPVAALADELPDVGGAISDMLAAAAVGAEGAAAGMQDLLTAAEATLVSVGAVAGGLGKIYELADKGGMTGLLGFAGDLEGTHGKLVKLNDEVHRTDPAAQEAVAGLQAMEDAMADLAERAESTRATVSGSNKALFDSDLELAEGYARLGEAVRSHGASLDINTESGRSNIRILEGMIGAAGQAADAEYQKAVATGNASGAEAAANATRAAAIQRIREHAAAVGMDAGQVNALIASLAALPRGTLDFAYRINVSVYGNVNAAQAVMAVAGGNTAGMTASQINNAQRVMDKNRAAGGPVRAGETYVVGEERPELFVPKTDGTIIPQVPPMSNPRPWGAAAAPSAWTLVLDSRGSRLDDLLVEVIREAVERGGGRVQDVLGRAGVS